ncbi:MAG TPA: sulfotransferase domain-containing protein [Rhodothermales bacterium]|nr:sulfotransferase domain-containing protein [Rhodothermales bacterium]
MKYPTVFHITHYKAGSQWVAEILKHSAPERFVTPQAYSDHVSQVPLKAGSIYPTVYLTRPKVEVVLQGLEGRHRLFVVQRDLRDTLVSLYFSIKISHKILNPRQQYTRGVLQQLSVEDGLLKLLGSEVDQPALARLLRLPTKTRVRAFDSLETRHLVFPLTMAANAAIQRSWLTADVLHLRYEDLIADEFAIFTQIIDYCEIDVPSDHLHNIIKYNTFESVTGRARGEEDQAAHQRKGITGDWRNYFTDRIKEQFKTMYGDVLVATGYEQDFDW